MADFRLTPAAEGDLEAIWTYTLHQWSAEQADRYMDTLTVGQTTFVKKWSDPNAAKLSP